MKISRNPPTHQHIETRHLIERMHALAQLHDDYPMSNGPAFGAGAWLLQAAERLRTLAFGERTVAGDAAHAHWAVVEERPDGTLFIRRISSVGRAAAEVSRTQAASSDIAGAAHWRIMRVELSDTLTRAKRTATTTEEIEP